MKTAICTIQNITKRHGASTVLGPLSLALYSEEILGIRGANGAGKSTLIKIIAGVSRADSGTVDIPSEIKKNIGYVPQDVALYPSLSGKHNLEFWAGVNGLRGKQKDLRISWLLKEVNLQDKAKVAVEEYSGGMRRRLNLAAALLTTPSILLLDEPTVGADYQSVEIILSLMKRMRAQGVAVLFISHQGDELRQVCNRIITMDKGLITQEDD